jgi:hypothetical protein
MSYGVWTERNCDEHGFVPHVPIRVWPSNVEIFVCGPCLAQVHGDLTRLVGDAISQNGCMDLAEASQLVGAFVPGHREKD